MWEQADSNVSLSGDFGAFRWYHACNLWKIKKKDFLYLNCLKCRAKKCMLSHFSLLAHITHSYWMIIQIIPYLFIFSTTLSSISLAAPSVLQDRTLGIDRNRGVCGLVGLQVNLKIDLCLWKWYLNISFDIKNLFKYGIQ